MRLSVIKSIFYKVVVLVVGLIIIWRLLFLVDFTSRRPIFGISFVPSYAEYLGLDVESLYTAMLDDLEVKYIRLGAYWNRIENKPGQYNFSELDWLVDEAGIRGVKVMLVVGRRLPRWPECHVPQWAQGLSNAKQQEAVEKLVEQVVLRYRNHPVIEFWQIENEPFLQIFGICPVTPREFVKKEVALVKSLDPRHPTLTTDSGELATWFKTAHLGDYLGTTTYRVVYHPWFGYVRHNQTIPAVMYRIKAYLVGKKPERIILTELQAEPWSPIDLPKTPIDEQFKSMDLSQFKKNIQFSKKMGFPRVYLWGAEWWYWMKGQGYPEYWEEAKKLF
jgi:hypothetical protein